MDIVYMYITWMRPFSKEVKKLEEKSFISKDFNKPRFSSVFKQNEDNCFWLLKSQRTAFSSKLIEKNRLL